MTLEALNEPTEEAICNLFKSLDESCILTPEMIEQGFRRVYDDMTDIVIDIPLAYSVLDRVITQNFPLLSLFQYYFSSFMFSLSNVANVLVSCEMPS